VVPIFLILLLGIVEFARAWNIYEVLTDAAREGARRAVVDDPSITLDGVVASIQAAGNRAGITIETGDIQITGFGGARGTDATVRIEYEHELRWVGVLLSIFTGDRTVTMVSETVMRIE
jgi:Flp pilus assembly protein TadG